MARYARIFASIWSDSDFVALDANAQRIYLLLVTQPDVSHCGVLPLTERRWGRLAADTDADSVRAALTQLEVAGFVVTDDATEEVLVRSYVKHDGQWISPNGVKAIEKACSQVLSKPLAAVVTSTLKALTQGTTEAPPQGATEGDASPQQPAASSLNQQPEPEPAAAATQPDYRDSCPPQGLNGNAAAAAVIDLAVAIRRRASAAAVRNPARWEASLRRKLTDEHADAIAWGLDAGADPIDLAARIAGATRDDAIRAQGATL